MTAPLVTPSLDRQAELRTLRAANEAAARPPYAWAKLDATDLAWLITDHGWVVDDAPGPRVDLRQANLVNVDLRGVRLRQARLEGAVLHGADLRGADCFFAHFTDADLRMTQWEGAHLTMARMRGARLAGAHLAGVDMRQCWLAEADLSNANLDGADLSMAQMDHVDLHEASLLGAQLVAARMPDSDLRAAKLTRADLRSAHLERALLDDVDGSGATWEGAWCDDASFYGADLRDADLRGVRLRGAQLAGVRLAGARLGLIDLNGVDLTRVADLAALTRQPTGDERGAAALTEHTARAQALTVATDGLLRLRAALAATQAVDAGSLRRLRNRARTLQRRTVPRGTLGGIAASARFIFIGNGDEPGRVAAWSAALIALVALVQMALGGLGGAQAVVVALSGFTSASLNYFLTHTQARLAFVGIGESLIGDVLLALFIVAVVRRTAD